MKINPLLIILLIIAGVSMLLYYMGQYANRKKTEDQGKDVFNTTSIKGKIVFKYLRSGVQSIRVDNDSQTFYFRPKISGDGFLFHAHTALGDSMLKPAGAPLIIIKDSATVVEYLFEPVN